MPNGLELNTTPKITTEQLLNLEGGIQIMVPLNEGTLNSELTKDIKWNEMVSGDLSPTITIGGILFKALILKASIQPDGRVKLQSNNGNEFVINSASKEQTKDNLDDKCLTRISGYSLINEKLQFCFTLTKEVLRTETSAFLKEEFPERSWDDVYGECITLEAQAKPDNASIQALKSNWDSWGHRDIEFSNYYILLKYLKDELKKKYGWSSKTLREIDTAVGRITSARNSSSHQNLDDKVLQNTDRTINYMKTLIKGFEKTMGSAEVVRRCRQLEEKRISIENLKAQLQ